MRVSVAGLIFAAAVSALTAGSAGALGVSNRPADGFVYFHRVGADIKVHNAAVADCLFEARSTDIPAISDSHTSGLVGAQMDREQRRKVIAGNVENCMVVRGWKVVRVPPADGIRLDKLPPAQLSAALASWVGAPMPHGQVVRVYQPITEIYALGGLPMGFARPSLSLKAVGFPDKGPAGALHPARTIPAWSVVASSPSPPWERLGRSLSDGNAVVVLGATAASPANSSLRFVRLDPVAPDTGEVLDFTVATPLPQDGLIKRDTDGTVRSLTYVLEVPPGRWRLLGTESRWGSRANFCLGGPAFDVAAGEVIFAGDYTVVPNAFSLDLSLDKGRAALADAPGLAERLKPAAYVNGVTTSCSLHPWAEVIYSLELPGAPRVEYEARASPGAPGR